MGYDACYNNTRVRVAAVLWLVLWGWRVVTNAASWEVELTRSTDACVRCQVGQVAMKSVDRKKGRWLERECSERVRMSSDAGVFRYDGSGGQSDQWWPSRYGADDRLGSGNELTPERTLAALRLPQEGRVIELTRVVDAEMPVYESRFWKQLLLAHESLEGLRGEESESDFGAFEEVVSQSYQIGCHVDALGHVTIDGRFYNGIHYRDNFAATGMRDLGIERARPWVTRGVCLDITKVVAEEQLVAGFVIEALHLAAACERQGVRVGVGDAVVVHTGWGRLWGRSDGSYSEGEPGVGWAAAHWLTERRVSLVGADNWGFEPVPFENRRRPFVVHQHLIAESGTHILENVDTNELAESGRSEFLFVLAPLKTRGSTASMASPLAIL